MADKPATSSSRLEPLEQVSPTVDDILAISRAAQDLAQCEGKLLKWAHRRPDPSPADQPRPDPQLLIDAMAEAYRGHRWQPSDVSEFTNALPAQGIRSMAGVHAKSYHDLAWRIAERILSDVIGAVSGTQIIGVGWDPVTGLTRAPLPPYTQVVGWQESLRKGLRELPKFDGDKLAVLIEREAEFANDVCDRRAADVGMTKNHSMNVPESSERAERANRSEERLAWLAKAMLTVQEHPDWSDAKIAGAVGRDKSRLSRSKVYRLAAAMARGSKTNVQQGHITVDPDSGMRDVEAVAPLAVR